MRVLMTAEQIVLHLDAGDGWVPAGILERTSPDECGSLSSDPPDARREVYLFGWQDGTAGLWRSHGGADVEIGAARIVSSTGLDLLADLATGPHEVTIHRPRVGDVRVLFTLWRTPTCPGCERAPEVVLAEGTQVFCGNNDCHVMAWNPTLTLEQLAAKASYVRGERHER